MRRAGPVQTAARAAPVTPPPPPPVPGEQAPTMLSKRMEELEEVSKELLKVLLSDWADNLLRRSLDKRSRMDDKLLASQATAAQLVRELSAAEETVAKTLLDRESELQRLLRRLQELEEELVSGAGSRCQPAGRQQRPATGAGGAAGGEPAAGGGHGAGRGHRAHHRVSGYVTQLYYKISRIDWDYEAEPAQIKGIHYGPDIAQPIDIDGSRHSRCFVSDYLWSLVPTAW
ncbi:kinetochore protein Spc24 [Harpia harpyja]|uniref:kinetochore protein Spc24 n=1 Tax=Harpia harpyja TaxID=202280 RepID=UPI0022B15F3F|nr:kinetochore protein Spc24 [Harpia harpyja]